MTWTAIELIGLENLMLFMYDRPHHDAFLSTSMAHPFDSDPFLGVKVDRRTALASMLSWIQAVNDTTNGTRPDLYKIVTGK